MSPNSDNAMARFLFAILKQKNLRDIDWTQVANDPVLLEPIPNGHAARMRYSRFRGTVMGEPTKKSRVSDGSTASSKSRVSKSTSKTKKDIPIKKEAFIKSEYESSLSSYPQFSPQSSVSPYIGEPQEDFDRFPSPYSDDLMGVPRKASAGSQAFVGGAYTVKSEYPVDFLNPTGSDFDAAFDMYNAGSAELHSQNPLDLADPSQGLVDYTPDWTGRFPHDQSLF